MNNKVKNNKKSIMKDKVKLNLNSIYFKKLEMPSESCYYGMYTNWEDFAIDIGDKFKKPVGLDIYVRNIKEDSNNEGARVGRLVGDIYLVESMINKYKYYVQDVYTECDKYNRISVNAASCLLSEEYGLWSTRYCDYTNRNFMVIYGFYIEPNFRNNKIGKVVLDNLKKVLNHYYNVNVSWVFSAGGYIKEWNYNDDLNWYSDFKPVFNYNGEDFNKNVDILYKLGFRYFDYKYGYGCFDEDNLDVEKSIFNNIDDWDGVFYRILTDNIHGEHYYDYVFSEKEMATIDFILEKYKQVNKDCIYDKMAFTTRLDSIVMDNIKKYISSIRKDGTVDVSLSGYELYRLVSYIDIIVEELERKNKKKNADIVKLCLDMQEKINKYDYCFMYFHDIMMHFECETILDSYLYKIYFKKMKNYIEVINDLREVYIEKGEI